MNTDDEPRTLGEYVRQAREAAGHSQRQLAKLAGVQHTYLARIENGTLASPQPEYLQRIADALGIDVTSLFVFLGVRPKLPEMRSYFRRKLGVNADEAEVLAQLIEDYQTKQDKGGNT